MKMHKFAIFILLSLLTFFSCKERFYPEIISDPKSYLVVEGIITNINSETRISLTRTYKLDDTARVVGEGNAQVTVEGKDNSVHHLFMSGDGIYSSYLNLTINDEYRLRIKTWDGNEYLSSFVKLKETPPIDSISWVQSNAGVQLYANTHDPDNDSRYYLWDFEETWEIRSSYNSKYIYNYDDEEIYPRTFPEEEIYTCWKHNTSSNILIGSSARLSADLIKEAPLMFIPSTDDRLSVRYSILVRQIAIEKEVYGFYELMKKNTESLGSVFDAQPSEIRGNLTSVSNPGETVIGYVTAATIDTTRIFINHDDLASWDYRQFCYVDTVPNIKDSIRDAVDGGLLVFEAFDPVFGTRPPKYIFSEKVCVDCRARGGTKVRPSFW